MRASDLMMAFFSEGPLAIDEAWLGAFCLAMEASGGLDALSMAEARAQIIAARKPRAAGSVMVVPMVGPLVKRQSPLAALFGGGPGTDDIAASVRAAGEDPAIKAVVLDIASPGGSIYGITEAAAAIRSAAAVKPVIAVANGPMASAAYWLGSQATEIVATPSAEVGAIGVIAHRLDRSEAAAKEGVKVSVISAGKFKGESSEFSPVSDDERVAIQARVDEHYDRFVKDISKARNVTEAQVRKGFGEGRLVAAGRAKELGMVDRIATLENVLEKLGAGGNVTGPTASSNARKLYDPRFL